MSTTAKVLIAVGSLVLLGILSTAAFGPSLMPLTRDSDDRGDPTPQPTPTTQALVPELDGEWFAWVTVGTLDGTNVLGVDIAEMLSGEKARQAAIEDGVIDHDDDLPNDFYIDNDATIIELVGVAQGARFTLLSAQAPGDTVEVGLPELIAVYDGTYTDNFIYGVVPGQPIAMNLVVEDGVVTTGAAVYLP